MVRDAMRDIFHWAPAFLQSWSCREGTVVLLHAWLPVRATCSWTSSGDTMASVLPCHCKQVGAFLSWEGQHQCYGQTLHVECKALMFLLATASLRWPSEDGSGLFLTSEAWDGPWKPRESEGSWGDTGSPPSLILLLSLLPLRVYAH